MTVPRYIPRSWKPKVAPVPFPGQTYCARCETRTVSSAKCEGCQKPLCFDCRRGRFCSDACRENAPEGGGEPVTA